MELRYANTRREQGDYLRFLESVYRGDPCFRSANSYLLRRLFRGASPFCEDREILPAMVYDGGRPAAQAVFIAAGTEYPALQLAFFEALPGQEAAVDLLLAEGRALCRARGLHRITVGLNGHVNYGLGLLLDAPDAPPVFGCGYNPGYYADYFARPGLREVPMTSYRWSMPAAALARYGPYCRRLEGRYTLRTVSARTLRRDAALYADLCNRCFEGHPFYDPRRAEEDYEMLRELLLLAGPEFLILAFQGDALCGLALWYPDFNELISPGGGIGPAALLRIKLLPRRIRQMKLAQLAVLPEHSRRGLPLLLLREVSRRCAGRFTGGESSWILDGNSLSADLTTALGGAPYRRYAAWEMDVD